jgi:hypothetical protein
MGKEAVVKMKVGRKGGETAFSYFFTLDVHGVPDFFSGLRHFTGFVSVDVLYRSVRLSFTLNTATEM